jgi:hypothetical protein
MPVSVSPAEILARLRVHKHAKPSRARPSSQADQPPPGALRTPHEAARKLRISMKTLKGHVLSGALRYIAIGHGRERPRRMFTDADLDEFVANQKRKDVPCPSDATRARRSGNTISKSEIIAFSALRRRRLGVKPKP